MYSTASGLSPRVRGNPQGKLQEASRIESIPACTGNPRRRTRGRRYSRSIPACTGKPHAKATRPAYKTCPAGLSPRVRGNPTGRRSPSGDFVIARSIPACTGKPRVLSALRGVLHARVYPRVYGET